MPLVTTPQVQLVSFDVSRRTGVYRPEGHLQPLGDGSGNLVLYLEDVSQPPIEALRPEVKSCLSIATLHGDPQPVSRPPHAALQDGRDAKSAGNFGHAQAFVLERERGAARGHTQLGYVAEGVQNLLGETITEVLVLLVGAEIDE